MAKNGRGPMRRVNRDEYEQDLKRRLQLHTLTLGTFPEDREAYHFNKVSETLDTSHVQLAGLEHSKAALRQAIATAPVGTDVSRFPRNRHKSVPWIPQHPHEIQSMFFIRDNRGVNVDQERWARLQKKLRTR